MTAIKTAISLEEPLLQRIDKLARGLGLPRSRVLAQAAEELAGIDLLLAPRDIDL